MTPGKKSQGIYVCHDDGTPITLSASMIRNLLRVADFLPFMYLVGVFSVLFNRKSQRIGDMVAGTMVVYGEQDEVAGLFRKVYGVTAGKSWQINLPQPTKISELVRKQGGIGHQRAFVYFSLAVA